MEAIMEEERGKAKVARLVHDHRTQCTFKNGVDSEEIPPQDGEETDLGGVLFDPGDPQRQHHRQLRIREVRLRDGASMVRSHSEDHSWP